MTGTPGAWGGVFDKAQAPKVRSPISSAAFSSHKAEGRSHALVTQSPLGMLRVGRIKFEKLSNSNIR